MDGALDGQLEHLVEVAVEERAIPADGERVPAHHPGDGRGVEGLHQALHVALEIARALEPLQVAADGHVRDRVQRVEAHALTTQELTPPLGLHARLWWRQERARRIGDQHQAQPRIAITVAERVEPTQHADALLEHTLAALLVGARRAVVGQRAHDLDRVFGEELRQVRVRWRVENGQVAAIHDVPPERATLLDEPAKVGVQLRRAARDVDAGFGAREHPQARLHGLARHGLAPVRSGVDVTVVAGLIAHAAHVQLQDVELSRLQWPQPRVLQRVGKLARQRHASHQRQLGLGRSQTRATSRQRGQASTLAPSLGRGARALARVREPGVECRSIESVVGHRHMLRPSARFLIWSPCTSDAPPRIAAATCTASVICSTSAPFSSAPLL